MPKEENSQRLRSIIHEPFPREEEAIEIGRRWVDGEEISPEEYDVMRQNMPFAMFSDFSMARHRKAAEREQERVAMISLREMDRDRLRMLYRAARSEKPRPGSFKRRM